MKPILVSAAPPLATSVTAADFLRDTLPAGSALVQEGASPFVTDHGWRGTLHEFSVGERHLVAVDFPVALEHALLYAWRDPAEPSAAIDALRTTIPCFRDNRTLAQLTAVPATAAPLPLPETNHHLLFARMRRVWSVDGVVFDLAAAPSAGQVEVKYAVCPRPSMAELIAAMTAELGAVSDVRAYRGTTLECEHHALAYVTGATSERAIGVVYGDRHCVLISGSYPTTANPIELREFMARLTVEMSLRGCPALRVRQVVHAVPAGWAVRTRDLTTHLIAPDAKTYMTVLPAQPLADASTMTRKILYEDVISRVKLTTPISSTVHTTPHGLRGEIFTVKGISPDRRDPFTQTTAILSDERYRYVVRYVDHTLLYEQTFLELVSSLEPVPSTAPASPARSVVPMYPLD